MSEPIWPSGYAQQLIERIARAEAERDAAREGAHNLNSPVHAICNENLAEALAVIAARAGGKDNG